MKNFDLPNDFFEKQILMLGQQHQFNRSRKIILKVRSAASALPIFPVGSANFYKPGAEIASIENWDEKVKRIAEEAPDGILEAFQAFLRG